MRTIRSFAWLSTPCPFLPSVPSSKSSSSPNRPVFPRPMPSTKGPERLPPFSSNGYAFGYWTIDDVRIAGPDERSLTQVSSVIQAASTYKAYYFQESTDSDSDGILDWFEYRMFGDLSRGHDDDPDGDGFLQSARGPARTGSSGQGFSPRRGLSLQ